MSIWHTIPEESSINDHYSFYTDFLAPPLIFSHLFPHQSSSCSYQLLAQRLKMFGLASLDRLPWLRPSRGSWCCSPTTLFSSGGDLSSLPSTRLQTGSFAFKRRWWVVSAFVVVAHLIRWWGIFKWPGRGLVGCLLPSATSSPSRARRTPWLSWARRGMGRRTLCSEDFKTSSSTARGTLATTMTASWPSLRPSLLLREWPTRGRGKKRDRSGAEREARRKRARTSDQVEKERDDERVRLVSKRAGGLHIFVDHHLVWFLDHIFSKIFVEKLGGPYRFLGSKLLLRIHFITSILNYRILEGKLLLGIHFIDSILNYRFLANC